MKHTYSKVAMYLFATVGFSLASMAQEGPFLIADINQTRVGSSPEKGAMLGTNAYVFSADNESQGREVWITDGTAVGTKVLKDIVPGQNSSNPRNFTSGNGVVYFTANNSAGNTGDELWRTDGTEAGTFMVKDIIPGSSSSRPTSLRFINGTLYFLASDNVNTEQLWKSDGTNQGTVRVLPNVVVNNIREMVQLGNLLYFFGTPASSSSSRILYSTNGTEAGTIQVRTLANVNNPYFLTPLGNKLVFVCTTDSVGTELWVSDGTTAGTNLLKDIYTGTGNSNPGLSDKAVSGNTLFFSATDSLHNRELWKTDGTTAGTVLVKDINTGAEQESGPSNFAAFGNGVVFRADDGASGDELWKSDGTAAGTILVKDIVPGNEGSDPEDYFVFGNNIYFMAYSDELGYELYRTNGTTEGTILVKDISPGEGYSNVEYFAILNNQLLLSATDNDDSDNDLFTSDGTASGTELLKSGNGSQDGGVSGITELNGEVYFVAQSPSGDNRLYKTNGNSGNATPVHPMARKFTSRPVVFQNQLFFFSDMVDTLGSELYKYNPATNAVSLVAEFLPGTDGAYPETDPVVFNNELYLSLNRTDLGTELWKTDGNSIILVKDVYPGDNSSFPSNFSVIGNHLYFNAVDSALGSELWRTDGTLTEFVADIATGNASSYPSRMQAFGNAIYLIGFDGSNGNNMYKVANGVATQVEVGPNIGTTYTNEFVIFGDAIYFNAYTNALGNQIYKLKNDTVTFFGSFQSPTSQGGFSFPVVVDNQLYFTANAPTVNQFVSNEVWRTNGTTVTKVSKFGDAGINANPSWLTKIGCNVMFTATTPSTGLEWHITPKGQDTAMLVADVVPGSAGHSISQEQAIGGSMYYVGYDPEHGKELWKYTPNIAKSVATATICFGDTFLFNGLPRTESGTYSKRFVTAQGCDSLETLVLTVRPQLINRIPVSLCYGTSVTIGNQVYDSAGVFTFNLFTAQGCDSTLIIEVSTKPQINLVANTATTITASTDSATYQWINCADNTPAIGNSTQQTYEPTVSGSYAVIVSKNNCVDTSACVAIDLVGIEELAPRIVANAYPNPNRGTFTLTTNNEATFNVLNQLGQLVQTVTLNADNNYRTEIRNLQSGVYMLVNATNGYTQSLKIVVAQ